MKNTDGLAKARDYTSWTTHEDATLIDGMISLVDNGYVVNGTFKNGAFRMLEKYIKERIPGCNKKVNPQIKSRHKLFKKQYQAICEMRGAGFGWDPERHCITVDDHVFDDWLKLHPNANGLKNKVFPHFDKLAVIFGNNHAIITTQDTTSQYQTLDATNCVTHDAPSSSERRTRKKQRKLEPEMMTVFSDTMAHLQNSLIEVGQQIGKLADAFKQENEMAEKRGKLNGELKKVEKLTNRERYMIGRKMVNEPNELDFFFSLDDEDRKNYILDLVFQSP